MQKEKELEDLALQVNNIKTKDVFKYVFICIKGKNMDKQLILNKYSKPEDKLLISKMLDKIELSKTKKRIEYTDFLDVYQKHLLEKILKQEHVENHIISGGTEDAERNIIVFYPEKLKEVVIFNYKKILPIICI